MKNVAGIVLAAGSSSRFGGDKLAQVIAEKALVVHVVDAALDVDLVDVVVVIRQDDSRLPSILSRSARLRTVTNADHLEGISSSLRCGLRSLGDDVDAAVVLLGDEPEITAGTIRKVIDAYLNTGAPAVRASYGGRIGHPVLLDRRLWPEVLREKGDVGARRILDRNRAVEVVDVGGVRPIDVDFKEDLVAVRRRLSRN